MTEQPPTSEPGGWQPRFGLGSMLLVMLVFSVMAASGYYFIQALSGNRGAQLAFILFTLATPLLLVVLVSLLRSLVSWLSGRRRR